MGYREVSNFVHVVHTPCQMSALRTGTLENFLQKHTGVDLEAMIAYTSDGTRLQNENLRDLAGVQDQVRFSILSEA